MKQGSGLDVRNIIGFKAPVFNVAVISVFASKRRIKGIYNLEYKQIHH